MQFICFKFLSTITTIKIFLNEYYISIKNDRKGKWFKLVANQTFDKLLFNKNMHAFVSP